MLSVQSVSIDHIGCDDSVMKCCEVTTNSEPLHGTDIAFNTPFHVWVPSCGMFFGSSLPFY
jgi:hypothetical protein